MAPLCKPESKSKHDVPIDRGKPKCCLHWSHPVYKQRRERFSSAILGIHRLVVIWQKLASWAFESEKTDRLPASNPSSRDKWTKRRCCWHRGRAGDLQSAPEIPSVLSCHHCITHRGVSSLLRWHRDDIIWIHHRLVSENIKSFTWSARKASGEEGVPSFSPTHPPLPYRIISLGEQAFAAGKGRAQRNNGSAGFSLLLALLRVVETPTFCTPVPLLPADSPISPHHTHTEPKSKTFFVPSEWKIVFSHIFAEQCMRMQVLKQY